MRRAQDRARSARSRKNGARSATIESRALGALKLASCARSAQWECAREAGRFFYDKSRWKLLTHLSQNYFFRNCDHDYKKSVWWIKLIYLFQSTWDAKVMVTFWLQLADKVTFEDDYTGNIFFVLFMEIYFLSWGINEQYIKKSFVISYAIL